MNPTEHNPVENHPAGYNSEKNNLTEATLIKPKPIQSSPLRIPLTEGQLNDILTHIKKHPNLVLQIPEVRISLTLERLKRVTDKDIKTLDDTNDKSRIIPTAIEHNLAALKRGWALARPSSLIYPLSHCNYISQNRSTLKVLVIGPRSEAELLGLLAIDIPAENITALDLISYSPAIDVGDMHDMPYEDNSFDVVIMGWVLAYSNDNQKAASEVMRVARPNAHIAIGCEVTSLSIEQRERKARDDGRNYKVDECTTFTCVDDVLTLFSDSISSVIFSNEPILTKERPTSIITTIFSLT